MSTALPSLVGVFNHTPDSFSDSGVLLKPNEALTRLTQLIAAGADVIDIGAESTRPDATPVSPAEEWQRLEPILADAIALCHEAGIKLSLDSRHAQTIERALAMGVDWINDVSGLVDASIIAAVRDHSAHLVVMHSLSVPASKHICWPEQTDVVAATRDWCSHTLERLENAGISLSRVILDPGIGFGKTPIQNWQLLSHIQAWKPADTSLLVGHSRKSFLGLFSGVAVSERDALTRLNSAWLSTQKVDYLRVHDVAGHRALWQEFGRYGG